MVHYPLDENDSQLYEPRLDIADNAIWLTKARE